MLEMRTLDVIVNAHAPVACLATAATPADRNARHEAHENIYRAAGAVADYLAYFYR